MILSEPLCLMGIVLWRIGELQVPCSQMQEPAEAALGARFDIRPETPFTFGQESNRVASPANGAIRGPSLWASTCWKSRVLVFGLWSLLEPTPSVCEGTPAHSACSQASRCGAGQ